MPTYRIYTIAEGEHINRPARLIDCPDDQSALRQARRYLDGHALEVWDEKRKIGRLEPVDKEGA